MLGAKIARKDLNENCKNNSVKTFEIDKENEQQIKFVKDQFQEELKKRKEIMSLRKLDQEGKQLPLSEYKLNSQNRLQRNQPRFTLSIKLRNALPKPFSAIVTYNLQSTRIRQKQQGK